MVPSEKVGPGLGFFHGFEPGGRPAVEDFAAVLSGGRTHVHDPVGAPDHVEFVLDHEEGVARSFQAVEGAQEGLGVGGMQPGGRFVEDVNDAEEIGAHLGRQPQALQFAGREGGGAAFQGQVAQSEIKHDRGPGLQILGDTPGDDGFLRVLDGGLFQTGRGAVREGVQDRGQLFKGNPGNLCDVVSGKGDGERFAPQPPPVAEGALTAEHELRYTPFHRRALRMGEGMQHVAARAGKRPHVAGFHLRLERAAHVRRVEPGIDRHDGLLVGEENPVAILLEEFAPGPIHVVAQRHEDFTLVLAAPGGRPGRDGALADSQRWVGDHGGFRYLVHTAQAVALRASTFGRVG